MECKSLVPDHKKTRPIIKVPPKKISLKDLEVKFKRTDKSNDTVLN